MPRTSPHYSYAPLLGLALAAASCADAPEPTPTPLPELCNDEDDDGDGRVDEGSGASTWYVDSDLDGYGLALSECAADEAGPGFAPVGGDCDDGDEQVHPGAEERCDSGIDEDCDGVRSSCRFPALLTVDEADVRIVGIFEAGRMCYQVEGGADFNHDGQDDILVSALLPFREHPNGVVESEGRVYGFASPLLPEMSSGDFFMRIREVSAHSLLGWDLASGDLDGDGWPDAVVGAPGGGKNSVGGGPGFVGVYYGQTQGNVDPYEADAVIWGSNVLESFGTSVSAGGDMDGDGVADLVVGDTDGLVAGLPFGSFSVFHGARYGEVEDDEASATVLSDVGWEDSRTVVNDGDLNGDGLHDFVIGNRISGVGGCASGAVYVFFSPLSGNLLLSKADVVLYSTKSADVAGSTLTAAGDLNGDGHADLVIGAPSVDAACTDNGDHRGRVYVVYGPLASGSIDLAGADVILEGESPNDQAGMAVHVPGDLDGDGTDDLVIGTPWWAEYQFEQTGAIYINYGPLSGVVPLGSSSAAIRSRTRNSLFGHSVSSGDFNADGRLDLIVGAPGLGPTGDAPGTCYIFYGAVREE